MGNFPLPKTIQDKDLSETKKDMYYIFAPLSIPLLPVYKVYSTYVYVLNYIVPRIDYNLYARKF
jgi:hypothetical protein